MMFYWLLGLMVYGVLLKWLDAVAALGESARIELQSGAFAPWAHDLSSPLFVAWPKPWQ